MRRRRPTAARRAEFRLGEFLPYRLSVAAHAVSALMAEAQAREFGLPMPQWRVLAIVNEHGALTQQQIVPLSTMDKQMVSRAARALQRRGLLRRAANRADRRSRMVRLSARGRELFRRLAPRALQQESALLAEVRGAAVKRLVRELLRLQRRAEELRRPRPD